MSRWCGRFSAGRLFDPEILREQDRTKLPQTAFFYMFTRLSQSLFEASIRSAYTRRFREKGAQAEGVFWASRLSQQARFEQVLQDMKSEQGTDRFSLADIGCGYGALFDYIRRTEAWRGIIYSGVDINKEMISYCQQEHTVQIPLHYEAGSRTGQLILRCLSVRIICVIQMITPYGRIIFCANWPSAGPGSDSDGVKYHQPGRAVDQ